MGFFKSKKGSIISEYFMLLEDVGQLRQENMVNVVLHDEYLELSAPMAKTPITLDYAQITDVFYGAETEIIKKSKSPIGRAIAGGLLFGGAGAVVGAVSGSGTKEKKVSKIYFIISYTSAAGEDRFLKFEDTRVFKGVKLSKELKKLCGISDKTQETITRL